MQEEAQVFSYGIIGTPNGFQSSSWGFLTKEELVKLDLDSNLKALDPENLFKPLFRVSTLGKDLVSIAIYYPSTEMTRSRTGGFFGAFVAVNGYGLIGENSGSILEFLLALCGSQYNNGLINQKTAKYEKPIAPEYLSQQAQALDISAYQKVISSEALEQVLFNAIAPEESSLFLAFKASLKTTLATILHEKIYLYYENIYFSADEGVVSYFKKNNGRFGSIKFIEDKEAFHTLSFQIGTHYGATVFDYCRKLISQKEQEKQAVENNLKVTIEGKDQEIVALKKSVDHYAENESEVKKLFAKAKESETKVAEFVREWRLTFNEKWGPIDVQFEKHVSTEKLYQKVESLETQLEGLATSGSLASVQKGLSDLKKEMGEMSRTVGKRSFAGQGGSPQVRLGIIAGLLVILLLNITILVGIWFWPTNQFSSVNEMGQLRENITKQATQMNELKNEIDEMPNKIKAIFPPPPVQQDTVEAPASGKSQGTRTSNKEQERSKQGSKSTH